MSPETRKDKEDTMLDRPPREISAREADELTKNTTPAPWLFHNGWSITPFDVDEDKAFYDSTARANVSLAEAAPDLAFTVVKQSSKIEDLELKLKAQIEETRRQEERAETIARTDNYREFREEILGANVTRLGKDARAQLERLDTLLLEIGSSAGGSYAELIDAAADLVGAINKGRAEKK